MIQSSEPMNVDYQGEENDNDNDSQLNDFEINNSAIDLDLYTSGYTGYMRIAKLVYLAEHCPPLRLDSLRLALNYVTETYNTSLYSQIHKQLNETFNRK